MALPRTRQIQCVRPLSSQHIRTDGKMEQFAFSAESISSVNSYGYSPHPLSTYLIWIPRILQSNAASNKPFIISITSSTPARLSEMVAAIQHTRAELDDSAGPSSKIAIELNTSCPNIRGAPPPSYDFPTLLPLLQVFADEFYKDPTLIVGLKLPPYVYSTQFEDVVRHISTFTRDGRNPFTFFTSTNTLGSTLLFQEQTPLATTGLVPAMPFALPTALGGLAGEAIHSLALGNVYSFSTLLKKHPDVAMRNISIIGVGGVTSHKALERMKAAGATVVGCATLLGMRGVEAFETLLREV